MKQTLLLIGVTLTLAACGPAKMVEEDREINNFTCNQGSVSWTYIYNYDPAQYGAIREWFDMTFNISKETDKTLIGETNRSALPVTAAVIAVWRWPVSSWSLALSIFGWISKRIATGLQSITSSGIHRLR